LRNDEQQRLFVHHRIAITKLRSVVDIHLNSRELLDHVLADKGRVIRGPAGQQKEPPDRLRIQQQQILHRIEHLGHAGRVLSFPARLMGRRMVRTASRIAPRWAVAAAAAGLFVGVGVGALIDPARGKSPAPMAAFPPVPLAVSPVLPANDQPTTGDDDTFLSDLEMALSGPRTLELMPLDALTPRVQAVSTQLP